MNNQLTAMPAQLAAATYVQIFIITTPAWVQLRLITSLLLSGTDWVKYCFVYKFQIVKVVEIFDKSEDDIIIDLDYKFVIFVI